MKKLLGILAISSIGYCASAQDSTSMMKDTGMMKMHDMKKDCIIVKDGKVMIMRHGEKKVLDSTINLGNGAMVSPDGTVKMSDGTTKMIKEGEYVDMDGKMGMMKKGMKDKM